MSPKAKKAAPAAVEEKPKTDASPSTVETYNLIKSTPEWKSLFSILVLFLANCVRWNKLKKAVDFLSKIISGMNKAYVPEEEVADPFPIESVFDPKWQILPYDDSPKCYTKPGTTEYLKSVTTILKNLGYSTNALVGWAKKICFQGEDPYARRDWAADVGKISHYLCECWLKKCRPEINRITPEILIQAKLGLQEFLKWEKESGVVWVKSELSLIGTVGKASEYGGTIDIVGIIGDQLCLLDIKTGSGVYLEQIIQVAAYRHLTQQRDYYNLNKVIILHIPRGKGKLVPVQIPEEALNIGLAMFLDACDLELQGERIKKYMEEIYLVLGQKAYN